MKFNKLSKLLALAALLVIAACGKKGPPLPPLVHKPAPALELRLITKFPDVVLEWKVGLAEAGPVEAFEVLVAASALGAGQCDGCPLIFRNLGKVRFQKGRARYQYRTRIRPGFKYTFKIRSLGRAKGLISDSKAVTCQWAE